MQKVSQYDRWLMS